MGRRDPSELIDFDRQAACGSHFLIGVDEVGRGSLAGPLVACAVLLEPKNFAAESVPGLGDSKQLSEAKREQLYPLIAGAVSGFHFAERDAKFIDDHGIQKANEEAMIEAALALIRPGIDAVVLVDGNGIRAKRAPDHLAVVKGDGRSAAIACASVLAKVHRDHQMIEAGNAYPQYSFEQNKGYGSGAHREAIATHGFTRLHRRSFCHSIAEDSKLDK